MWLQKILLILSSLVYSSGSQQVSRDPHLGRVHLLLGRQNLCFSTTLYTSNIWVAKLCIIVFCGSQTTKRWELLVYRITEG